jgi:hypothetical protein
MTSSAKSKRPAPPPRIDSRADINPKRSHVSGASEIRAAPVIRPEHSDPDFTRLIEQQTAKIPSHWFLFASIASMGTSLGLAISGNDKASRFVGMWAPTLLILGVYNKLVKIVGPR